METWFIVVLSLCISLLLKSSFSLLFPTNKTLLPPGPATVPVIGNLVWLRKSFFEIEILLRGLKLKYGPILTLRIGSRPSIFVSSHDLAHRALVQNGAVFSDRPKPLPSMRFLNSNQHNISSAAYGPTWRLLRRNLTSEILHPARVKSYSRARTWVLGVLLGRLSDPASSSAVRVVVHLQYAMFCLLVLMCFGDKLDHTQIKQIEKVQRDLLLNFGRFNILNFMPRLGKLLFSQRWRELHQLRQNQDDVLIPLIEARKSKHTNQEDQSIVAYVDTLLKLQLPEEGNRRLTHDEMVTLCSEFLNAGTDTTSTALQWIMANLVKCPEIQAKLYHEIVGVVGPSKLLPSAEEEKILAVEEEDLQRMPYLKAVVLEALRLHPPGHFVLPHAVTRETELNGYVVPKNATINFMVAEMGRDPEVWKDPMEFKPERFLNGGEDAKFEDNGGQFFDLTGSREIKMMPFGAGRRICPGSALALLHLEYFVANLVWYLEWKPADGHEVDLAEKQEFTVVMKNPLIAHIYPRVS